MAKQVTINKSFYDKVESLEDITADAVKEKAYDIATYYVGISPVDTGAFVTSGSITIGGGGRSRTSNNKPRGQNPEAKKQEAFSQLSGDIEAIDFTKNKKFVLRNRSPHANSVEKRHSVFASIRNVFG